jgi:Ca2+-dependent lipid-binding protein
VKDSIDPRWAETAELIVTNPVSDILKVVVRDEDVAADDDVGVVDISLAKATGNVSDAWYPITETKKRGGRATLHLTLQLVPSPPQPYSADAPGAIGKFKKA